MIETQQTVDTGCSTCDGSGWLREPWDASRGPRDLGLRRCVCNPAPIAQVADGENKRAFSNEAKATKRGDRRKWWAG